MSWSKGFAEWVEGDTAYLSIAFTWLLQGMVIVSGYPSALYDELFAGWHISERAALADSGKNGRGERTEVLWINHACMDALERARGGLFAEAE